MLWFLFQEDKILLSKQSDSTYTIPEGEICPWKDLETLDFPIMEETTCRVGILAADFPIDNDHILVTLRQSFELLSAPLYKAAGKAAELLYWHRSTAYCSACGSPLAWDGPISKKCRSCDKEYWPALTPAIIVAITRNNGKEILLVQSKKFKGDYYGLVAGFVETGESLEECLRREVREETGYDVKNIRYFDSQPWPYPNGLMIGFTAEYDAGEFCLQESELRKGGWFSRKNLPAIPGKVSLARRLIDHWLQTTD